MLRLRALAAMLLAAALLTPATPVLAWGNSGDGYGSHDWIIDQAVKVLDGRASWFDASAARLVSDDPDFVEKPDPLAIEHVYRGSGKRGGAVSRAADEYDLAMAAFQAGAAAEAGGDAAAARDGYREASIHIGLLSHFVGDISEPFHSAYDAIGKDSTHKAYEELVNNAQLSPGARPDWQSTRRTVTTIANVRTTVAGTAAYSRQYFAELYSLLVRNGIHLTSRVAAITGAVMKRATNDLADIIWSISQGAGAQADIGSLKMSVRWTGILSGAHQLLSVKALDVNGKPIEGLKVVVRWPTATGSRTEYLYTDPTGYQSRWATVGTGPKLVLRPAVGRAVVRGTVTTVSRAWTISPRLATGSKGFSTSVSAAKVVAGQTVKVTSRARDAKGRAVPNLLVTWTWSFGSTRVSTHAYTDSTGRASSTQLITVATPMTTVTVTAHTQAGSTSRSSKATFRRTG